MTSPVPLAESATDGHVRSDNGANKLANFDAKNYSTCFLALATRQVLCKHPVGSDTLNQ